MKKIIYLFLISTLLSGFFISCKKEALDPTLAQEVLWEDGLETVDDVLVLLNGAYNRMTGSGYYGRDFIIWGEVRSDNCVSDGNSGRFVGDSKLFYTNSFGGHWTTVYRVIAVANIIINHDLSTLEGADEDADLLDHYLGQAYAIRALAHYDLLIYYGQMHTGGTLGIPYLTTYEKEFTGQEPPARSTITENVSSIFDDIEMAISLMDPSLDDNSKEYFTHYGAQALKARAATYFDRSADVIDACEAIIDSENYIIIPGSDFAKSFVDDAAANSIFELAFSSTDNANINGLQYIYRGRSYGDVQGLPDLYNAFDPGDVRAAPDMIGPDPDAPASWGRNWTNLGKYPSKDYSDNVPIFRYEEVLLNYAEALWREGETTPEGDSPLDVLNLVPAERNAILHTTIDEDIILLERRRELCFEGIRFHDIARTERDIPLVDPARQLHDGFAYGSYEYAFPIPLGEMDANKNMVQNDGY
ncbi:MAG: RagB/SusD family nutrient uptake outer membrane protein [Bacteroidales bacterium]